MDLPASMQHQVGLRRRQGSLTMRAEPVTLCSMKPAVYLTDPEAMRKVRLNQPRVTSEQARAQREHLRRASEKFFADAKSGTCSPGQRKVPA